MPSGEIKDMSQAFHAILPFATQPVATLLAKSNTCVQQTCQTGKADCTNMFRTAAKTTAALRVSNLQM